LAGGRYFAIIPALVEAINFGGEDFTQNIGARRTREGLEIFVG
jgi:citrate lyase beta subunit